MSWAKFPDHGFLNVLGLSFVDFHFFSFLNGSCVDLCLGISDVVCPAQAPNGSNESCRPRPRTWQCTAEPTQTVEQPRKRCEPVPSTELCGYVQISSCTSCLSFRGHRTKQSGSVRYCVSGQGKIKTTPKSLPPLFGEEVVSGVSFVEGV